MALTFEEKVQCQIMFHREIGEVQAAKYAVHMQEAVDGLSANNDSFVRAYRERIAAEQSVQLTASGVGMLARFGKFLVRLGWWLAKIGGN